LERWVSAHGTPQQVTQRCRIILGAAAGRQDKEIAEDLQINFKSAALWRARFLKEGTDCLWEVASGRGRKTTYPADKVGAIIEATLQTKPAGATHWSCRSMAKAHGVSKATVNRIWQSHQIKPHRTKGFKLSRDPRFLEKLTDVVGLYLNPPAKALVLCVDEKSQIQALDRTQPGLPLKRGRCGTMTHDYKRNGTTTLFAALEVAQGKVVGQCYARHRHQEFIKFLKRLDDEFPMDLKLHVVMDNYGTHKHPSVQSWLKRHPRFIPHFIPTSSSWLNLVERWFGELTGKRIRRGVFVSVDDLKTAIDEFLAAWNEDPKPLVWTATVDSIVEKLNRCKQTLETIKPGCTQPRMRKNKGK
ncbi:MAG: IS630 family transposase, partial [bacterium]